MLITDRLVYVQLQKTASTRIAEILRDAVGGELVRPKHGPVDARAGDRYVVGSVRDPWAYYLSLWSYGCQASGGLYERLTGLPRRNAGPGAPPAWTPKVRPLAERSGRERRRARRWADTYRPKADPKDYRRWLRDLLDPTRADELGEGFAASSMSAHSGIYTYRYCVLHVAGCRPGAPHWNGTHSDALLQWVEQDYLLDGCVRVEHMADDLIEVLTGAGYDLDDGNRAALREAAGTRSNTSGSGDRVAGFYDRRTRDLVTERERLIIERHGYEPPEW